MFRSLMTYIQKYLNVGLSVATLSKLYPNVKRICMQSLRSIGQF